MPKLKYEHIYLSSFAKMRVDLAAQVCVCKHVLWYLISAHQSVHAPIDRTCIYAVHVTCTCTLIQVLSESVSKALQLTGGEEVSETVQFDGPLL